MVRASIVIGLATLIIGIAYLAFNFGVTAGHESIYSAFNTKAKSDVSRLGAYLAMYELDHGDYPNSLEVLEGDYLEKMIRDPWGNDYGYIKDESQAIIFTNGEPGRANEQIFHVEKKKI